MVKPIVREMLSCIESSVYENLRLEKHRER
jgi:hypothetical protein